MKVGVPTEITAESVGRALIGLGARAWQIDQTAQVIAAAVVDSVQSPDAVSETAS